MGSLTTGLVVAALGVLAATATTSCSRPGDPNPVVDVPLRGLVDQYVVEMETRGVAAPMSDVSIRARHPDDAELVGVCYIEDQEAEVDPSLVGGQLRAVVYHELTHCIFRLRRHDAAPLHIMSARISDEEMTWTVEEWRAELDRLAEFVRGGGA